MHADTFLTIGLFLAIFSVPAYLSALADGRPLRAASLCMILAGGSIVWALSSKPGGYRAQEIPTVVIEQIAKVVK
ncbi:hypothetical protein N6L24_12895 [Cognatishimia sp. SS12]|uniref:hypothetical protein n=1 Tax=Cognatishimia sp. SS12 TaxID=2979465 RepID=UPI00232DB4A3|nr:hypothetical protein [Cognatishimia sp. SS12]MDC0739178.1 hypothetical protein [Cognatishimia sp. SS12]